jgi:cell division protein FtsB
MKYKLAAKNLETTIAVVTSDGKNIDLGKAIVLLNLLQENLDLRDKQVVELSQEVVELSQENNDLRSALEAFASEVAFRRLNGFCPESAFDQVSNNQICRTAITHASSKSV